MAKPQSASRLGASEAKAQGVRLRRSGEALVRKGRLREAIDRFAAALEALPGDLPTLFHLARTADRLGMADGAIRFYEQILAQAPDQREAVVNLSHAYRSAGRGSEAVRLLQDALSRREDDPSLWHALGSAKRETADREGARVCFTRALECDPRHGGAAGSLADLDLEEGHTEDALTRYDVAVRNTDRGTRMGAQMRLSHALALLQAGRLAEGWTAYGARFAAQGAREGSAADRRLKRWTGQSLKGRPLKILAEQGVGDQLMFAACLPAVLSAPAREAGPVSLTCEPRLAPLLARSLPGVDVHATGSDDPGGAPGYWSAPLADMPARLWPERAAPLTNDPFLRIDPVEAARWRAWLDSAGPGPHIGLCWRSGRRDGLRGDQYAPFEAWIGLARRLRGTLVCVQYDAAGAEIAAMAQADLALHQPPDLDQKQDIDRATALLSVLDRVITAPTAVAYQAALAGTRTIRLLPFAWWTHLGTGRDAFAPALEDRVAPRPGLWDDTMDTLAASLANTA
ncbi:MAG: tetratricopeptide repeat protein [Alphaproteobacteria bacterium]